MGHKSALEFANVGTHLLQPVALSKRCAITNVDPVGVIERFTFADVARDVAQWAHLVREKGLQTGDRVLVLAGSAWEWRSALLGVLHAGGVAVPCPTSFSMAELRSIAADAGSTLVVSIRPRPDLVDLDGALALSAEELESVDASEALAQAPHQSKPGDVGLILYAPSATGLRGAMHAHASLIAQADAGEHWLGIGEDERVWCTAPEGSAASIWLLLAAWRGHADIVNVNLELDPEGQLELLDRLRPSAVWLSDEEYGVLASAAVPSWIDLGSIRRALASEESSVGATAFEDAFGARVTPLLGLNEVGVVAGWPAGAEHDAVAATAMPVPGIPLAIVDEQGKELPADRVGNVVVRGDAPSLCSGYTSGETKRRDSWFHLQCRGALGADNSLRLATRPPLETELVEAEVDMTPAELVAEAAFEEIPDAPETTTWRSRREAKRARRRDEREAQERRKAEERGRREEDKNRAVVKERKEAESAEDEKRRERERRREEEQRAKERKKAEAAERAQREAAEAAERRRLEEAARAKERRRAEEAKRQEQGRRREEELARERERAEAEERARREAQEGQERRREAEAARAEQRRREEEEKQRERERLRDEEEARRREEQLALERQKAEAEERARREAAEAEERRRAEEAARAEERRREEEETQREQERLARERDKAEAADRARREAAEAEERRRAEEAARAEERRREKEEKQREQERLREEEEARRREERLAKERAKAEAEERARREAAEAEERRRAEEAARAEERQREEEEKQRERERRREEKEARRREERQAKEAPRAQRKAARLGRRRRSESEPDETGERRQRDSRPGAEPERLTADILSRISQYGMKASSAAPDEEAEAPTEPRSPAEPTELGNAQ
jgi:acyl-CoA synthetase (AMP-forming)/AMP-acid ligase II